MAPNGYSDTKLMNGLFVKTLAQKFPSEIQAYAVCPGNDAIQILAHHIHVVDVIKVIAKQLFRSSVVLKKGDFRLEDGKFESPVS